MNNETLDIKSKQVLLDYQIEATCQLGDWNQLAILQGDNLQSKNVPIIITVGDDEDEDYNKDFNKKENIEKKEHKIWNLSETEEKKILQRNYSWGAQKASLISALKQQNEKLFKCRIDSVRSSLMHSVLAMTMENSETHFYSQVSKYIVR